MIRPRNINIGAHTADFKCDKHDASITGLNVNTNASYEDGTNLICVKGSELTTGADTCTHISFFPNDSSHTHVEIADLAQAKTS